MPLFLRNLILVGATLFLANFSQTVYANCWDISERAEIESFSELDGFVVFSVKTAETCAPVTNYTLSFGGRNYKADRKGYVQIDMVETAEFTDSTETILITADGYIELKAAIPFEFGSPRISRFLMSKKLPPGTARFVLQWGKNPKDLDLHLKADDYHISYHHKKSVAGKATLDRDDRDGFGPETITLNKIREDKTYRIFVVNYSGEENVNSEGYVQVYIDNRLIRNVPIPTSNDREIEIGVIKNRRLLIIDK